jgi:hypothetical protein
MGNLTVRHLSCCHRRWTTFRIKHIVDDSNRRCTYHTYILTIYINIYNCLNLSLSLPGFETYFIFFSIFILHLFLLWAYECKHANTFILKLVVDFKKKVCVCFLNSNVDDQEKRKRRIRNISFFYLAKIRFFKVIINEENKCMLKKKRKSR